MMHIKNLVTTTLIPGSDNWQTAVLTVDPETATSLLEGNHGNRRLNPGSVARYAAAMRKGDWKTSPEPLIFAPNGRLLNGQTRLHAIKATGLPQKFLCVFGVAEEVFSVLDRGRPRTLADAHSVDMELAQVARLLVMLYCSGFSGSAVADSDFVRMCNLIESAHAEVTNACNTRRRLFSSAPFRAAAALRILNGESKDFVLGLYRHLVLGEMDMLPPAGHAAIRAALSGTWSADGGGSVQRENLARAWNLFSKSGTQRTKLPLKGFDSTLTEVRNAIAAALVDSSNV